MIDELRGTIQNLQMELLRKRMAAAGIDQINQTPDTLAAQVVPVPEDQKTLQTKISENCKQRMELRDQLNGTTH